MFPAGKFVTVEINFHMRRPNSHFRNGNRWWTALTDCARKIKVQAHGGDIDNLAKFVLDGMSGVVYHDDNQVVKLMVSKNTDTKDDCAGRTVVTVSEWEDGKVHFL